MAMDHLGIAAMPMEIPSAERKAKPVKMEITI